MIIILLCAVGGILFGLNSHPQEPERAAKRYKRDEAFVVYAIKPIPTGTQIKLSSVEERKLNRWKVPDRAVPSIGFVIGKKSATDISSGQILLMSDLASEPTGSIRIDNSGAPNY